MTHDRIAMVGGPRENDPQVGKVLALIEDSEREFQALKAEGPRLSRKTHDENARMVSFWAGYVMGLKNAVGMLPVYRTHYDPPEGFIGD
jgi:hypothetical protein